jgi:rubrerythrin
MSSNRLSDFLAYAIKNEQEAAALYEKSMAIVKAPAQKQLLKAMSVMERNHEAALKRIAAGEQVELGFKDRSVDLRLSDYLVDLPLTPESDLEDVVIFAIKAEQKAFELYSALARLEEDPSTRRLLEQLASEEKKHKVDLELQFEKQFLNDN